MIGSDRSWFPSPGSARYEARAFRVSYMGCTKSTLSNDTEAFLSSACTYKQVPSPVSLGFNCLTHCLRLAWIVIHLRLLCLYVAPPFVDTFLCMYDNSPSCFASRQPRRLLLTLTAASVGRHRELVRKASSGSVELWWHSVHSFLRSSTWRSLRF